MRLLDDTYTLDDIRSAYVSLTVAGTDNFRLEDGSSMTEISRDIEDLMGQTLSANHQYPDGVMLFTGTMFTPNQDRDRPGGGGTRSPPWANDASSGARTCEGRSGISVHVGRPKLRDSLCTVSW